MASSSAQNSLFQTIWIANSVKGDVNALKINFNNLHTCLVSVGSLPGSVTCNWTENFVSGAHYFGLTGGSISLLGSCSVAGGTGQAQGMAAGAAIEGWNLKKAQ